MEHFSLLRPDTNSQSIKSEAIFSVVSFGGGLLSFGLAPPHCPSSEHVQEIVGIVMGSFSILGSGICGYFLARKLKIFSELDPAIKCHASLVTALTTGGVVLSTLGISFCSRCL